MVYLLHQPVSDAVTQSLIIVAISSTAATFAHTRAGHVRWWAGVCLGVIGGAAASLGTMLSRLVPASAILGAFAVLMVLVAISLVTRTRSRGAAGRAEQPLLASAGETHGAPSGHRANPVGSSVIRVLIAGIVVGLLTGFFGVGGGFVIVPALVLFLGYPMPLAVGTSLLVIALNSLAAVAARIGDGTPDWAVVAPVAAAAIVTAVLGKIVAQQFSESTLTKTFAVVIVIIAGYVTIHSVGLIAG
jgi:uncharacterized membrane protein YfcA